MSYPKTLAKHSFFCGLQLITLVRCFWYLASQPIFCGCQRFSSTYSLETALKLFTSCIPRSSIFCCHILGLRYIYGCSKLFRFLSRNQKKKSTKPSYAERNSEVFPSFFHPNCRILNISSTCIEKEESNTWIFRKLHQRLRRNVFAVCHNKHNLKYRRIYEFFAPMH